MSENEKPLVATSNDVLKKFDGAEGMQQARKYDEPAPKGYEEGVAAAMVKTFGAELDEDSDLKDKGAEPAAPKEPEKKEEAPPVSETSKPSTEGTEKEESAPTEATPSSGLDPVLVRSLKRKGYSDDEIAAEYKDDPKSFEKLAKYVHKETTADDARALEAAKSQPRQAPQPPTAPQITAPPSVVQPGQPAFDEDAMRKQYTDPTTGKVHPIVETLIAQQKQLAALVPQAQEARRYAQEQQHEATRRMVEAVFAAPENTGLHEELGKDEASLTPAQREKRMQVVRDADALFQGYRQMGRPIREAEALQRSIDMYGTQNAKASARAEIKSELAKRAAATTLKPTSSRTSNDKGDKSKASKDLDVREKVRARMKEVFAS